MKDKKLEQATSVHFELQDSHTSSYQKYRNLTIGEKGLFSLLKYELIMSLCGNFPGAFGYFLRSRFFNSLLKERGQGIIWGRNVTLRHAHKIELGTGVAINDFVVLDAYGGEKSGIKIGDQTLISRNTVLNSKGGQIEIGSRTNIGMMSTIFSRDCRVKVGNDVLISAYCYLMGGGNHSIDRTDIPISLQGAECKGIEIGDNVWLGAGVRVMDGCSIGRDSVIGTNSFVNQDIPAFAVAAGSPARVINMRK
jgi:acetyltransferase-like isoleucine patch superfamily enzyme